MNAPSDHSEGVLQDYEWGLAEVSRGNFSIASTILEKVLNKAAESTAALVCNDLGVIYQQLGDSRRAVELLRRGLQLDNGNGRMWINLARCLKSLGQAEESLECARRAFAVSDDPDILIRTAEFLSRADLFGECANSLRKAIECGSNSAAAWTNLGNALNAQGRIREGQAAYERALQSEPDSPGANANHLFALHLDDLVKPESIAEAHFRWGKRTSERIPRSYDFGGWDRSPNRPVRVGILASDLRRHSIVYFLAPLLENWDPDTFPITVFSNVTSPDQTTERLRTIGHRWIDVSGNTRDECGAKINKDRIDILIEIGGHTSPKTWEVLARKPAPVQIAYLAYPDTTGLPTVDYLLTDEIVDPPHAGVHLYSEQLLRLPGCLLCYKPPAECPKVAWEGWDRETIVFGSCAQRQKLSEHTLSLWLSILQRTPGSRLLLKSRAWRDPVLAGEVGRWFAENGVNAERIETIPHIGPIHDHLAFYNRIDICLDTYPYSGITTTCEALWMGVPVIALPGRNQASRVCASILNAAGVPELVANGDSDYVDRSTELAANRVRLRNYRSNLRHWMAASPLMDARSFTRSFEEVLRKAWLAWAVSGIESFAKTAP